MSPELYREFRDALVKAFPNYADLAMMVKFGIGEQLPAIVAPGAMEVVCFNLITWAEARGKIELLILAARQDNPGNPALRVVAERFGLASSPRKADYERIVLPAAGFQNPEWWREAMSLKELTVCRIEIPGPIGVGTGFLLGPSVLMTNAHVVNEMARRCSPKDVGFRFDYRRKKDGVEVNAGALFHLAEKDWLVDESPENSNGLDYALLKLDSSPGSQPIGKNPNSPARGWLTPERHRFQPNEPLLIIQHPSARPLELAIGSAVREIPPKSVEHLVNTEQGSSGSPCFTIDWKLVALHHWGSDSVNRAVVFTKILERLETAGKLGALGT